MVFLYDLTMPEILRRIVAALIHAGLQGGLLALLLTLMGDPAPCRAGDLTANPFRHLRLSGVLLCLGFRLGWIRAPGFAAAPAGWWRWRASIAVLLSLGLLLALVPVLDLARAPLHRALPMAAGYRVLASIDTLQAVLVGSVLLALLPLPGLLLGETLPVLFPGLARRWRRWQGLGLAAAAVLVVLGWFPDPGPLLAALRLV